MAPAEPVTATCFAGGVGAAVERSRRVDGASRAARESIAEEWIGTRKGWIGTRKGWIGTRKGWTNDDTNAAEGDGGETEVCIGAGQKGHSCSLAGRDQE